MPLQQSSLRFNSRWLPKPTDTNTEKIADSVSFTQTELNFGVAVAEIDPQHIFQAVADYVRSFFELCY